MRSSLPVRHALALAVAGALSLPVALAQQVIADGTTETPAPGEYATTGADEHAFHVLNAGRIESLGAVILRTEGDGAAGARIEGLGSTIHLDDATIITRGDDAAGVSIAAEGGQVHALNVSVETHGARSHALENIGSTMGVEVVNLLTYGNGAHGMTVSDGGWLNILGGQVVAEGSNANAVRASGLGSEAHLAATTLVTRAAGTTTALATAGGGLELRDVQVLNEGATGFGVVAQAGSEAVLTDTRIQMQGANSVGLSAGGTLKMQGGSISAMASGSRAVQINSAQVQLQGVQIQGNVGISLIDFGTLDLVGGSVLANDAALDINGMGNVVRVDGTVLHSTGDNGAAVRVMQSSRLDMVGGALRTDGNAAVALDNRAGTATLRDVQVQTTGMSSHGLHTDYAGFGDRPRIDATTLQVSTSGSAAIGAVVRNGGSISLTDSLVLTTGSKAHGVLAGGSGALVLSDTHVRAEGEEAYAAVINDRGRLTIDGGSLVSAQHGGVWVRSTRDPGLTLGNGAVVSGGNGIALALDAAVAGRFDVALEGGAQLLGDIVTTPEDEAAGLVPQSQVHVRLADASLWQGASDLVQTLALDDGSQWTLTGDATVGELQVRDSLVAMSEGSGRFNTLTVDGDLHSEGATFLFNGALGDDSSAMDRLHVRGDTSGDAQIAVRNIGGVGAETVDGIRLIEVDGASLASYTLAGRAVGGAYEYFLFQGGLANPGDGAWYLRSQWFDHCAEDPFASGCSGGPGPGPGPGEGGGDDGQDGGTGDPIRPRPVLRPEAGAYLANQSAAVNMFDHRLHERMGAVSMQEGRTAWARVGRSAADFTAVGGQLSVDGSTSVLQMGGDVLRQGNAAFGVMLGSGRTDSRVASDLTGYTANGRVRGTAVGVYGTWMQDAEGTHGAYVDASLQHGRFDNRVQGIGLGRETYDSRTISTSLEGGYTFNVWQGAASQLYLQPQVQVSYTDYRADRHVEQNGTVVDRADAGGLNGRVGVRVFGHGTAAGNRVQPYLGMNWLRASGTSTVQFNGNTVAADVPRNRYEMQTGAELKLGPRWGAWTGLSVQRGDYGYRNVSGQLGMRMAW